jgi:hypothetical protein
LDGPSRPGGKALARSASLEASPWLPTYAWWPQPDELSLTVVLSPYHSTVEPEARFAGWLRGYAGSKEPLWEHEVGEFAYGDEVAVELAGLDVPSPPDVHGGVLEVHVVRTDRTPRRDIEALGMWLHAEGPGGGGYLIPTIPIRGQRKDMARDDLQVFPGVMSTRDTDTEIVLLNPIDRLTEARITVSSADGLVLEGERFEIPAWSAWRGSLSGQLPRARQLLAQSAGIGSAAVYSSHKLLPYFGFRRNGSPLAAMDHGAPIFA